MSRARDLADGADKDIAGTLTLDDIVLSNDMSVADDGKVKFGAGNDLQIYHDGTHSYVQDAGTGDLRISGNNVNIMNGAATENYIVCTNNGSVAVKHDNATKLETSSTGVDVTGNVTMTSDDPTITMTDSSGTNDIATIQATSGALIVTARDGSADGEIIFKKTDGSATDETLRITSGGNVGIGTDSPQQLLSLKANNPGGKIRLEMGQTGVANNDVTGEIQFYHNDASGAGVNANIKGICTSGVGAGALTFGTGTTSTTERMRITNAGSVFVNTTTGDTTSGTNGGIVLNNVGSDVGRIDVGNTGTCFNGNRSGSHGDIYVVRYQGSRRGALMTSSTTGQATLQGGNVGITFTTNGRLNPTNASGAASDNAMDLGQSDKRFDDVFATNGTIQTSDQNEKQQIASLTTAEITAAKEISKLFKTFKWNSSVAEKGDAARTHSGVIAQDVQQAMADAGLDASDYAFFISDTWWETDEVQTDDEGVQHSYKMPYYTADEAPEGATQRTRLGIRYPELLAFVGAATEQRLADIETRLAALEAAE